MLVAGVVLSCNKVSRTDLPAPQPEVTIRASIPDDATRVGAQYGFSWSWEATDRLTVIGEDTQTFNIKKGFSAKFAEFTGRPVSGESFTILYPGVDANTADWSNQSQQGNGGTAHLRYTSALEGVDAYESFTFSSERCPEVRHRPPGRGLRGIQRGPRERDPALLQRQR